MVPKPVEKEEEFTNIGATAQILKTQGYKIYYLEKFCNQALAGNLRPQQRMEFTWILAVGETKSREGHPNSWDLTGRPRAETYMQVRFKSWVRSLVNEL